MVTANHSEIEELQEELTVLQDVEELERAFSSAGGHLDSAAGELMEDASDPTRLVPVYKVATGEQCLVPIWTLKGKNSILLRRLEDGRKVFATRPGAVEYKQGSWPCMLSAAYGEREKMLEIGLGIDPCPAEHLANRFEQRQHMIRRHPRSWDAIQEHETQEAAREMREFQRLQTQVMNRQMATLPPPPEVKGDLICSSCGFEAASAAGLAAHQRSHLSGSD